MYLPSDAINPITWWLDCKKVREVTNETDVPIPCWNPTKIRTELGYAAKLGFNFVRVFAHNIAFEPPLNPNYDFSKLEEFIKIAHDAGIRVMPVVFDSCSVGF